MSWWMPHNFDKKRDALMLRAKVIKALRSFFDEQDFIEVQTPALQVCPVMDAHIHGFKTELLSVGRDGSKDMYLHTSPEFDMKKLLTAGMKKIYQICPVYRNAEGSRRHSPEFTILEWYRSESQYTQIMDDTVDCLRYVARSVGIKTYAHDGKTCDPFTPALRLSVCDAFKEYADITLEDVLEDRDAFAAEAMRAGVRVAACDEWDDIFHAIMAEKVEPHLGLGAPTILFDYPVSMAALSRKKPDDSRFAERFELYVCGLELANAFSELTDVEEQRKRYEQEMKAKQELYGETYPPDEEFFAALEFGMPESAGIALGVDRLVMLACDANDINDVLWAPVQA